MVIQPFSAYYMQFTVLGNQSGRELRIHTNYKVEYLLTGAKILVRGKFVGSTDVLQFSRFADYMFYYLIFISGVNG